MRTASGPYLALDLMTGQVLRATNGLVPFFLSDPAGSATGSTSLSLATQLAEPGILPRSVPIRRTGQDRKARTALKGSLVRRELLEHRPHGILDADVLVPQAHDPFWGNGPKAAIRLHEVRNVEAQAQWWTARLSGRWLHAPALERPVIDRLLEAGS
jgi:hypothetical protein